MNSVTTVTRRDVSRSDFDHTSVTTVTRRDVSRSDFDHTSVTTVTTPYGVSQFVTVIRRIIRAVPMPHFSGRWEVEVRDYAFALYNLGAAWIA